MKTIALTAIAICLILLVCRSSLGQATCGRQHAEEIMRIGLRGVYFVPNQGQWEDSDVLYGFRSRGLNVAFRESSLTMHLRREAAPTSSDREDVVRDSPAAEAPLQRGGSLEEPQGYEQLTLKVTFPGSNAVLPQGERPQTARFNYFLGDDASQWATDVPSYGAMVYEHLYDGIDLHVTGSGNGILKYEFHCEPGANTSRIRIACDGIDGLRIDQLSGNLLIDTPFGTLCDKAPEVWQEISGMRRPIPAQFVAIDANSYTISLLSVPAAAHPVVIDPEVEWMVYLGGSDWDEGHAIDIDGNGNSLIAGNTRSVDFFGRSNEYSGGDQDAYIAKITAAGALQWMTYLGGTAGEVGTGIAVDSAGNALVTGGTRSSDFAGGINANHGGFDAFCLKVSPAGALEWMIYLGGSGEDDGYGIAVDSADNIVITGQTNAPDFEGQLNTHHGAWDAFTLKVTSSGSLQWMNYLGGSGDDYGREVDTGGGDDLFVAGHTDSSDFAGANNSGLGMRDGFALRLDAAGSLQWMMYLGGSGEDRAFGVAVNGIDSLVVSGDTDSTDFIGGVNANHGAHDAFVLAVDLSGSLQWMTYLGGSANDWGNSIAVDGAGHSLATGQTASTDFDGRVNDYLGSEDATAVKLNPSGELLWMTYLGGTGEDRGFGIALDTRGSARVIGETSSGDFVGRLNTYYDGGRDAFIAKLAGSGGGIELTADGTCPGGGPIRIEWSGATPNGPVALIFATCEGNFLVPPRNPCQGTQLGLGACQIQVAWSGRSDGSGSRVLNSTAGDGACGKFLQLLDLTTCETSNVAGIE